MKKIKLQTIDHTGELIKQEVLEVTEGETVILKAEKKMPFEQLYNSHNAVKKALIDESVDVITFSDSLSFKVLKVN